MLRCEAVAGKRRDTERRKATRATPSPESIQTDLNKIAESVRNLQTDVEALIKRPNVLPWRLTDNGPDKDPDKDAG
jgi:hypothetical protein